MKDGQGAIRVALAFAALLASLSLVISRQSRALSELRALDAVRSDRAVAESERSGLRGRVQMLESRSHVLEVAGQRLGMRVPAAGREIVVLLRNLEAVDSAGINGADDAGRAIAAAGSAWSAPGGAHGAPAGATAEPGWETRSAGGRRGARTEQGGQE